MSSYCRMDYEGFRLLKDSWPRMKAQTNWKENPDWQGFTVVSQYDVVDSSEGLRAATVRVQYAVMGRFQAGLGYTAEPGSEEVSFRLKDMDSAWKIEDLEPTINPHVSRPRAVALLKTALAAEKDAVNRIALQKALKIRSRFTVVGYRFSVCQYVSFSVLRFLSTDQLSNEKDPRIEGLFTENR